MAQLALQQLQLSSSGSLDDYQAELRSIVQLPAQAAGNWQLNLSGDRTQLQLESLQGSLLQGELQAQGSYQLDPPLQQGELQLQLSRLQLAGMLDENELATALPPVSGGANLRLDQQQLRLQDLLLQAADLPWQVRGDASYGLDDDSIASSLRWQALDWPPGSGERADWGSEQGQLSASGTLQDLQLDLNSDVSGSAMPAAQIALQASLVQLQSLQLQQLIMQTLGGEARLAGTAAWGDALQAQLDYQLQNIDPGQFWAGYPGNITASGSLLASANADFSAPQATVAINDLSGTLRGQPISGQGTLRYADQQFISDGLQLQSGDASLNLRGDEQALQMTLDIPSAGQLYAAAAGSLKADISMQALPGERLRLDRGQLQLQLSGTGLGWQQQSLEAVSMDADLILADAGLRGDADITLQQLSNRSNKLLREASLQLVSDSQGQRLQLSAARAGTSLGLELAGSSTGQPGFAPWRKDFAWQGSLQDMQLQDRQLGLWQQPTAAQTSAMFPVCCNCNRPVCRAAMTMPARRCASAVNWPAPGRASHFSITGRPRYRATAGGVADPPDRRSYKQRSAHVRQHQAGHG